MSYFPQDRQEPSWQKTRDNSRNANIAYKDPLADIYTEGIWRLCKVTPLFNLKYDVVLLKQYSSRIRQAVISTETKLYVKYTVNVEAQPCLKYNEEDADGLMITVLITQENTNKAKVAFQGLLLSWGMSKRLDEATHLPYMLDRGEKKLSDAVKTTLQTMFDCSIQQYSFTQYQLLQFGFKFTEYDMPPVSQFALMYKTPQIDNKHKVRIALQIEHVSMIWNGVKEEAPNNECVNYAYQVIHNQIVHTLSFDISKCELYEVVLPKAQVKSNGTIKMKSPEIVNCVFTLLNDISGSCEMRSFNDVSE